MIQIQTDAAKQSDIEAASTVTGSRLWVKPKFERESMKEALSGASPPYTDSTFCGSWELMPMPGAMLWLALSNTLAFLLV